MAETLVELAREWLAFAEGDLAIAQAGALATAVPGWAVALHCQQAVEKSAKGALVLQSIEPRPSATIWRFWPNCWQAQV